VLSKSKRSDHQLSCSFIVVVLSSTLFGCGQPAPEPLNVTEAFDGNSYDRSKWQLATPNEAVGVVEVKDDALLIMAPPADQARPQIAARGKFAIDGDFEASMDFQLLTPLPDPEQDYINLELILAGSGGMAHLSRSNHKGSGNGIVAYFAPESESVEGAWKHSPTDALKGTLKFVRKEAQLEFLFQADNSDTPELIVAVPYGTGPIQNLVVALSVSSPTKAPVKLQIDNLRVATTDRGGVRLVPIMLSLTLAILLSVAGVAVWLWRTGKLAHRSVTQVGVGNDTQPE
jgi:hypothetical protein